LLLRFSEIIRSYLGTQLLRATFKLFKRFKLFRYFFFNQVREENPDLHKYVVTKSTRIDRAFVIYSQTRSQINFAKLKCFGRRRLSSTKCMASVQYAEDERLPRFGILKQTHCCNGRFCTRVKYSAWFIAYTW